MNFYCNNISEGIKCNNRITIPNGFCNLHKQKSITITKNKLIYPLRKNNKIILPKTNIPHKDQIILNCRICLCEIEENEEDTGLICKHRFHVDCINNIHKPECPICREPLNLINSSKVDINKIKQKETEEKLLNEQKQINEDLHLGRRLQNEDGYNHNNYNNHRYINNLGHHILFNMEFNSFNELNELDYIRDLNTAIENSMIMFDNV